MPQVTRAMPLLAALAVVAAAPRLDADVPPVELAVVVHPGNPTPIAPQDLDGLFLMKHRWWPDGTPVVAFNYAPESPLRVAFERAVLRLSADEVARYWLDQRIRTGARPPRQVDDPAIVVKLVARVPGAIAYVPAVLVDRRVRVVARIRQGKLLRP